MGHNELLLHFETAETMIGKAVHDWKRDWFPQQSLF